MVSLFFRRPVGKKSNYSFIEFANYCKYNSRYLFYVNLIFYVLREESGGILYFTTLPSPSILYILSSTYLLLHVSTNHYEFPYLNNMYYLYRFSSFWEATNFVRGVMPPLLQLQLTPLTSAPVSLLKLLSIRSSVTFYLLFVSLFSVFIHLDLCLGSDIFNCFNLSWNSLPLASGVQFPSWSSSPATHFQFDSAFSSVWNVDIPLVNLSSSCLDTFLDDLIYSHGFDYHACYWLSKLYLQPRLFHSFNHSANVFFFNYIHIHI